MTCQVDLPILFMELSIGVALSAKQHHRHSLYAHNVSVETCRAITYIITLQWPHHPLQYESFTWNIVGYHKTRCVWYSCWNSKSNPEATQVSIFIQHYGNIIIDDMLVWVAVEESQCKHRLHCCTIIASTIPNFGGEKRGVRLAWYILTFSILQNVSTVRQSCHKLKPIGLYQRVSKFVGALTSIHNVLIWAYPSSFWLRILQEQKNGI